MRVIKEISLGENEHGVHYLKGRVVQITIDNPVLYVVGAIHADGHTTLIEWVTVQD